MSIDINLPQIGRIYDYVLGGTFNYEADRKAAQGMINLVPAYPHWARLNRDFLADVGRRWAAEGRRRVLDLGSGLPTQGHFNEHLSDAKILFTDADPLTVTQGQQLLAYSPDMAFYEGDLRRANLLVDQAAAFFGVDRALAIGCIGVVYFLADDDLRALMATLHHFCAPGSVMAVSFPSVPDNPETRATIAALSEHARIAIYPRTPEQMAEVLRPWRMTAAEPLESRAGEVAPALIQPDHPLHQMVIYGAFVEH